MSVEDEIISLIESEIEDRGFVTADDFGYAIEESLGWGGSVDVMEYVDFDAISDYVRNDLADPDDALDGAMIETQIENLQADVKNLREDLDRTRTILVDSIRIMLNRFGA